MGKLKVTIQYTDKDHPYSFSDEDVLMVDSVCDAEDYCRKISSHRQYWSIVKVEELE